MIARVFWLVPFLLFFAGYYTISWFIGSQTVTTPSLTGKRLHDVVTLLTPYQLNLRILGEIEDGTLAEGTVISQKPLAGQKIKFYQSVGVIVSRHAPHAVAPNLLGLSSKECSVQAENERIRLKVHLAESNLPKDQCIAQYPTPGTPLPDRTMTAYISKGQTSLRIVPNLSGRPLQEVRDFFKESSIPVTVVPSELQEGVQYDVIAQKPSFGSLIDLSAKPHIQVFVQPMPAYVAP